MLPLLLVVTLMLLLVVVMVLVLLLVMLVLLLLAMLVLLLVMLLLLMMAMILVLLLVLVIVLHGSISRNVIKICRRLITFGTLSQCKTHRRKLNLTSKWLHVVLLSATPRELNCVWIWI